MGRPVTPKRGYRTMSQDQIFKLTAEECKAGIKSCQVARSLARIYKNEDMALAMEIQIGAFIIQRDMLEEGDVE